MESALYLASRSPRRQQLLAQLGLAFELQPADIDERRAPGQSPEQYARATALAKAQWVASRQPGAYSLGADTDVVIDGQILGKPPDAAACVEMLLRLSNREHEVLSAVALLGPEFSAQCLTVTTVRFGTISAAEAAAYWDTGEPADKAGGYAVQGLAARFVRELHGSYSGVVGLPLFETAELLQQAGFKVQP